MTVELKDAVGIGVTFIVEEHIFTFLLSSPFTARNLVKEKGDVEEVKKDLLYSLYLSIGLSFLTGFLFESKLTMLAGILFATLLYTIYAWRGEIWT